MNHRSVFALAISALLGFSAAWAQAPSGRATLLKEPGWLLESGGRQAYVWFEAAPDGSLQLVKCPNDAKCRVPVFFDDGGMHLGAQAGAGFAHDPAAGSIPMFTGPAGALLMPAWVVPTSQSRAGF